MKANKIRPHDHALQVYRNHLPRALGLLAVQVAVRLLAFAPLIYALATGSFPGFKKDYALAAGLLFSIPLYVLLVMPLRFQAAAAKQSMYGLERDSAINGRNYTKWLAAALLRLVRALPFLLPFAVFIGLYMYYMSYPDFTVPMKGISDIGNVIEMDFIGGIAIIGLVGLLLTVLAVYGWKRDLAFEHQDVLRQGIRESLQHARDLRARRRRVLNRTIFVNFLLCLPAIVGVLAVLGGYLLSLPRLGMFSFDFLNMMTKLLQFDFPGSTLLIVLAVLLVLWLPLLPWRKLALTAVLADRSQVE